MAAAPTQRPGQRRDASLSALRPSELRSPAVDGCSDSSAQGACCRPCAAQSNIASSGDMRGCEVAPSRLSAVVSFATGLVLMLLGSGLTKFTPTEAQFIQPLLAHSPFMAWLYGRTDIQGVSNLIAVVDIGLAALLAVHGWRPHLAAVGGVCGAVQFLITVSCISPGRIRRRSCSDSCPKMCCCSGSPCGSPASHSAPQRPASIASAGPWTSSRRWGGAADAGLW